MALPTSGMANRPWGRICVPDTLDSVSAILIDFCLTQGRMEPQDQQTGGNPHMPQTEKPLVQPVDLSQNAGINVVNLGADDTLQGRLEVQGDLKIAGKVEGELRATGNITIDSSASVQASIEGSNVSVRGQVTGTVTARRRLTLGGSGRLSGDVKVGRLNVEDGTTLNGNVTMSHEKG